MLDHQFRTENYVHSNLFIFNFQFCSFQIYFKNILKSQVLPHINPLSFDGDANFGDSVQLTCHVSKGDLPLKIKWLFKEQPLFAHLGILTSKFGDRSSFLTVPSVTADNSGNYTCVASNEAGQTNYTARLNVHGRNISAF